jgi:hypothetical protein
MFVNCNKCPDNKKESQFKLICKIKNMFVFKIIFTCKEKSFVLFNFGFSNCEHKEKGEK